MMTFEYISVQKLLVLWSLVNWEGKDGVDSSRLPYISVLGIPSGLSKDRVGGEDQSTKGGVEG
jgi:hypothetical protein